MSRASRNMPNRTDASIQNHGGSFKYVLRSARYITQFSLFCILFNSATFVIRLVTTLPRHISLQGPELSSDRMEGPRQGMVC